VTTRKRRPDGSSHPVLENATSYMMMFSYKKTIKSLRYSLSKANKKVSAQDDSHSIETLVYNRTLPKGGMKELQSYVQKEINDWAAPHGDFSRIMVWNDKLLRRVQELILAGFLSGAPQGRIKAFVNATNDMGPGLISSSSVLSKEFKTSKQFGFQPIIVPDLIRTLLTNYIKIIRPKIVAQLRTKQLRQKMAEPQALLFINLKGNAIKAGSFVGSFFRNNGHINTSPNKIRSMVSTEVQDLCDRGMITPAHRDSVDNINGHSSQITREFYLRRSRFVSFLFC